MKLLSQNRLRIYCLFILIVSTAALCRPKIKPSDYQIGLQAYYRSLVSDTTEAGLKAAIADLNKALQKSSAEPGLLALRASAYLELVRLKVQGATQETCGTQSPPCFDDSLGASLLSDLRLLDNMLAQVQAAPPWLPPRLHTLVGDLVLLKATSIGGDNDERSQITLIALYRLAADRYLHAAKTAQDVLDGLNADDRNVFKGSIDRETRNARDGYVNSLNGMAQSEDALGLSERALKHLQAARQILLESDSDADSNGSFPPKEEEGVISPSSLYAYLHAALSIQSQVLIQMQQNEVEEKVALCASTENPNCQNLTIAEVDGLISEYEFALKEEIAARLFTDPMQSFAQPPITAIDFIQTVLLARGNLAEPSD